MRDYDIKRGHYDNIDGRIPEILEKHFGEASRDGEWHVSSYGAIEEVRVKTEGKTTATVDSTMDPDVDMETAKETRERWNDFLLELTGFNAKKRRERLKDKAKEDEL